MVGPEVHGATAQVALEQIDIILEQCAVRTGSEIAWMVEEIDEIEAYAGDVAAATGDPATTAALDTGRSGRSESLELDDLVLDYNLMSEALSSAIEACMADPAQRELRDRGIEILRVRRAERETVIRANWRLVGRG